MREFESYDPRTNEYKITNTRHLRRGLTDINFDTPDATVRIGPSGENNPPRLITKVTARGLSEEIARAAALEEYNNIHVDRIRGILRVQIVRTEGDDTDVSTSDAGGPRPEVQSSFRLVLPEGRERDYDIDTRDGSFLIDGMIGPVRACSNSGDVFIERHRGGKLDTETDSGRIVVDRYSGTELHAKTDIGQIFVRDADGAEVSIRTVEGSVNVHGTELLGSSNVVSDSGPITIGITNDDLYLTAESMRGLTIEGDFNTEADMRLRRGEEALHVVRGTYGEPEVYPRLAIITSTGEVQIHKDTGTEGTTPLPPVSTDPDEL